MDLIWANRKTIYFCAKDWTGSISMNRFEISHFSRNQAWPIASHCSATLIRALATQSGNRPRGGATQSVEHDPEPDIPIRASCCHIVGFAQGRFPVRCTNGSAHSRTSRTAGHWLASALLPYSIPYAT
jgi:hypothetical protein